MEAFMFGILGVFVGALLVMISHSMQISFEERRKRKKRTTEQLLKEIEVLNLLNKKIHEILYKREIYVDKEVKFLSIEDCYISMDDFIYLESFAAQNTLYLPTYLVENFFKDISYRKAAMTPNEMVSMGGNIYKGGRMVLELFSENIMSIIDDRKAQLDRIHGSIVSYGKVTDE